ncbi:MAG: hypothetical protein WHS89_14220 [Acidimicrobiales bacterium]
MAKQSVSDPAVEFLKARAIADLGQRCGFVAPRPLSYQEDSGTILFERVPTPVSLIAVVTGAALDDESVVLALLAVSGRALGAIHRHLDLDQIPQDPLPAQVGRFLQPTLQSRLVEEAIDAPVVGHGDFGTANLYLTSADPARARVVVLDPFPNFYSSFHAAAWESRYLDLALFDTCLVRGSVRSFLTLDAGWVHAMRSAFIGGYREVAGVEVDLRVLGAVSDAVLASYLTLRRRWPSTAASVGARLVGLRRRIRRGGCTR